MTKSFLMTLCSLLLAVSAVMAQDAPAQKPADNGPSLEVTMKFIQEKLKAKGMSIPSKAYVDVEAEPTSCQLKFVLDRDESGNTTYDDVATLPLREVEKIEVLPAQDYWTNPDISVPPGLVVLRFSATTLKSVHRQQLICKRDKCKSGSYIEVGGYAATMDEDLGDRVAKATVHAVELCGGGSRPEPF
jgi:hypothetical protein